MSNPFFMIVVEIALCVCFGLSAMAKVYSLGKVAGIESRMKILKQHRIEGKPKVEKET